MFKFQKYLFVGLSHLATLAVIARSETTKQSCVYMVLHARDCFATLAMTTKRESPN